jgi:hypothetical protein
MNIENRAIGLYAVAARDFADFIDMVREEESNEVLKLLYNMLITPNNNPHHDQELNDLISPIVKRELERRVMDGSHPKYFEDFCRLKSWKDVESND